MVAMYIQGCRALAEGNWKEATACFDKIVLSDPGGPDVAPAHVGLLCAKLRVNSLQSIKDFKTPPTMEGDFARALQSATGEYKQMLINYQRLWAEAERKAKQHKKHKRLAAMLTSLFFIAGVVLLCVFVIVPNIKYKEAVNLFSSAQYGEAATMFDILGNYKDSREYLLEASYQQALKRLENKQYDAAANGFDALGAYKNSMDFAKEAKYCLAEQHIKNEQYDQAAKLLIELDNYKDSKEKRKLVFEHTLPFSKKGIIEFINNATGRSIQSSEIVTASCMESGDLYIFKLVYTNGSVLNATTTKSGQLVQ